MIMKFAERNRDIKVVTVENIRLDNSDGETSSSPPDSEHDQDQEGDPRNGDDHDEN